jgi:hypothetical protein
MEVKKNSDDLFEDLDDLLGAPVLLKSEDLGKYRELEKLLTSRLRPKNFLDALDLRDLQNAIWEGKRFQEHAAELVNAERPKALKKLIDAKSGYVPDTASAAKLTRTFRAGPKSEKREAILLQKLGLSGSAVDAHAVLLAANDFLILDKLAANRSAMRKTALKDYERRQRLVAKGKAAKVKREHKPEEDDAWK